MKLLKQALAVLGTVVVIAMMVALVTPKTAHALVATAVQVVNTAAQSVPTLDAENPARTPFQASCNTFGNGFCTWTVPASRRLVIEFFNAQVSVPIGTANIAASLLFTTAGGTQVAFDIAPGQHVVTIFGDDRYVSNASIRLYADPGTIVYAEVPGGDPISQQSFNISGYTICENETTTC